MSPPKGAISEDTIAAAATPPGEGGVAIVRISGAAVRTIIRRIFRPFRAADPGEFRGYTVHYGHIVEPTSGGPVDDGLLTLFRAPASYTGEDVAELSCHGGRATTAAVLFAALAAGARPAEPGEFTLRAFLNGRMDLAQAEAVADLVRARTESSRRLAQRQLEGGLSRRIALLRDELVGILAAIEVTIDFSEEVGELDYAEIEGRLRAVCAGVDSLLAQAAAGRILREGLRLAIVGRPNVGKSSLMNALLRTDRAIVTAIPGTTRDLLEEACTIAGLPVVLVDTAGLRQTTDEVESIGIERAQAALASADVALLVIDASAGVEEGDHAAASAIRLSGAPHILIAANKCDLIAPRGDPKAAGNAAHALGFAAAPVINVSAVTGFGLTALENAIAATAGDGLAGDIHDSVVISSARHLAALQSAHAALGEALATSRQLMPGDFIAIDARAALDALGRITGETVTDEIIHRIFHEFCVGK